MRSQRQQHLCWKRLPPALIKIIELATMAVTAIGQLFAALTGKGTVIKATNAYKDYAASLKKTVQLRKMPHSESTS